MERENFTLWKPSSLLSHLPFCSYSNVCGWMTGETIWMLWVDGRRNCMDVVFFLLCDSPTYGFYVPTFRKSLPVPSSLVVWTRRITRPSFPCSHDPLRWNSVPKRRHVKFRRRGITQRKEYSIKNRARFWNQGPCEWFHQNREWGKQGIQHLSKHAFEWYVDPL
jgi:hypothetical protein